MLALDKLLEAAKPLNQEEPNKYHQAPFACVKQAREILKKTAVRRIYHTTHVKNLPLIIESGLMSHNTARCQVDISNPSANARRNRPDPVFGRSLHNYAPCYFNPRNAFMYANIEIINQLVTLEIDIDVAVHPERLISVGNAACRDSHFTNDLSKLNDLPQDVFADSWYSDYHKRSIMMSELLIPDVIPVKFIRKIRTKSLNLCDHLKMEYLFEDFEIVHAPEEFF